MTTTTMTSMWQLLKAHTLTPAGKERAVNQNNEWGGFSKKLGLPVFTGWFDMVNYDREAKTTTALVCDADWTGRPVGFPNQERWLEYAEINTFGIAAFFIIHAVDANAEKRSVKYIDHDKVFVGPIVRDGGKTYIVGKPQAL